MTRRTVYTMVAVTTFALACGLAVLASLDEGAVAQPRPPAGQTPTKRPRPRCAEPRVARVPWQNAHDAEDHYDGRATHVTTDVVVNPGAVADLRGKFAYGRRSRDMEREWVVALVRDRACGPWTEVGRALTDADGRVSIAVPATRFPTPGRRELALIVPADGSRALGSIWVLARGTEIAVFDIDGTLTTGDDEVIEELLAGRVPAMYPSANDVVQAWAASGRQPVYVTGRPYLLQDSSRRWLDAHGFPPGPVRTTDDIQDSRTDRDHVGRFKRDFLRDLITRTGVVVTVAYGNALTDVCAYAEAGIPPDRTYIIGQHAGAACGPERPVTQGIRTYAQHLAYARERLIPRR